MIIRGIVGFVTYQSAIPMGLKNLVCGIIPKDGAYRWRYMYEMSDPAAASVIQDAQFVAMAMAAE
jgi:hypothetical protein